MEEKNTQYLTFILEDETGYVTSVYKEFQLYETFTPLESLISELSNCLLACGYSRESIEKYINPDGIDIDPICCGEHKHSG